jgi:CheY-like chemotaxis protein
MTAPRILFVDDAPNLRLTFPPILQGLGYVVRSVGTVAEALAEITTREFDVLISDLNIGEAGDGYTVVSAMRRTQPGCICFIVTGFPAFESALAAIQGQVDGYFVKPANMDELVSRIESNLKSPPRPGPTQLMRLYTMLRENIEAVCEATLLRMKADPTLRAVVASDAQRRAHFPAILREVCDQLASSHPEGCASTATLAGRKHGMQRAELGYDISMLVTDFSHLDDTVHDFTREHLLLMDLSHLVMDLRCFDDGLHAQLKASLQSFWNASRTRTMAPLRTRPRRPGNFNPGGNQL